MTWKLGQDFGNPDMTLVARTLRCWLERKIIDLNLTLMTKTLDKGLEYDMATRTLLCWLRYAFDDMNVRLVHDFGDSDMNLKTWTLDKGLEHDFGNSYITLTTLKWLWLFGLRGLGYGINVRLVTCADFHKYSLDSVGTWDSIQTKRFMLFIYVIYTYDQCSASNPQSGS